MANRHDWTYTEDRYLYDNPNEDLTSLAVRFNTSQAQVIQRRSVLGISRKRPREQRFQRGLDYVATHYKQQTAVEMAHALGVKRGCVLKYARYVGVKLPDLRPPSKAAMQHAYILKSYGCRTLTDIAKDVGLSESAISQYVIRTGIRQAFEAEVILAYKQTHLSPACLAARLGKLVYFVKQAINKYKRQNGN